MTGGAPGRIARLRSWLVALAVALVSVTACDDGGVVTTGIVIDVRQTDPATVTGFTLRTDDGRLMDFRSARRVLERRQLPEHPPARPPGLGAARRGALRRARRRPGRHPPRRRAMTADQPAGSAVRPRSRSRSAPAVAVVAVVGRGRTRLGAVLPVPLRTRSATASARRCRSASTCSVQPSRSASRSPSSSGPTSSAGRPPPRRVRRSPGLGALACCGWSASWPGCGSSSRCSSSAARATPTSRRSSCGSTAGSAWRSSRRLIGPGLVVARPLPVRLRPAGRRRPATRGDSDRRPDLAGGASGTGRRWPSSPSSSGSSSS